MHKKKAKPSMWLTFPPAAVWRNKATDLFIYKRESRVKSASSEGDVTCQAALLLFGEVDPRSDQRHDLLDLKRREPDDRNSIRSQAYSIRWDSALSGRDTRARTWSDWQINALLVNERRIRLQRLTIRKHELPEERAAGVMAYFSESSIFSSVLAAC